MTVSEQELQLLEAKVYLAKVKRVLSNASSSLDQSKWTGMINKTNNGISYLCAVENTLDELISMFSTR